MNVVEGRACIAGQQVSTLVSHAAGGGASGWVGALTWLAPLPPSTLPPYLYTFAQVCLCLDNTTDIPLTKQRTST